MSTSAFFGLQTALSGLAAHQRALDTTAHNIANASTPGYSRQQATLTATSAKPSEGGLIGTGVDVAGITRARADFADRQYRIQTTAAAYWTTTAQALCEVEDALAEPTANGIGEQLGRLWNAWSDFANAPNSPAAKQALASQGATLADAIRLAHAQLQIVADHAADTYRQLTRAADDGRGGPIAQAAHALAAINQSLAGSDGSGPWNDLLDRRDFLLDELSQYGSITTSPLEHGAVDVAFSDTSSPSTAYPVVIGGVASWSGPPATGDWSPGGRLGALLDLTRPGGAIDRSLSALDTVATRVVDAVNGAYGGQFFITAPPPSSPAGSLDLATSLKTDPGTLRAGGSASGANDRALAVAALRNDAGVAGSYSALVTKLGADSAAAQRRTALAQSLVDAAADHRDGISGVSLDEEMVNLVKYQRGYQASARVLTVVDQLLDVLINHTGRAGL